MIITAILGALVLVGGGVTAVILVKGGDTPQATVEQEPGPAGPSVISQKAGEVTRYGDVPVFDACTVLPATAVEELGFKDAAHGWHNQRSVPKSVPVADATGLQPELTVAQDHR